jgi:hypothetical protein
MQTIFPLAADLAQCQRNVAVRQLMGESTLSTDLLRALILSACNDEPVQRQRYIRHPRSAARQPAADGLQHRGTQPFTRLHNRILRQVQRGEATRSPSDGRGDRHSLATRDRHHVDREDDRGPARR